MNERNEKKLSDAIDELDALQGILSDIARYAENEADDNPNNEDLRYRADQINEVYEATYTAYIKAIEIE